MNILLILLTATILCILLTLVEILKKNFKLLPDLTRKLSHILSGLSAYLFPYFLNKYEILVLGIIFLILLFISKRKVILSSLHSVSRQTYGELLFPIGVAVSALIYLPENLLKYQTGILVLTFSDSLACIIGEKYGKHKIKILNQTKSLEGSITFFIVTFAILLIQYQAINFNLFLNTLVLTFAELFGVYGLDNLFIPIMIF